MKKFWCNNKKGFCRELDKCNDCEHYANLGGAEIEVKEVATNFDKITSSVEILAEYIEKSQLCPDTIHLGNENLLNECKVYKDTGTCKECILEWLQKECEE